MKKEKLSRLVLLLALPLSLTFSLTTIINFLLIAFGSTPSVISSILCAIILNATIGALFVEKQQEIKNSLLRPLTTGIALIAGYIFLFPLILKALAWIEVKIHFPIIPILFSFLLTFLPSALMGVIIRAPFVMSSPDIEKSFVKRMRISAIILCIIAVGVALNGWVLLRAFGCVEVLGFSGVVLILSAGLLLRAEMPFPPDEKIKQGAKSEKRGSLENLSSDKVGQIAIIASICLWYSFASFEIYITRGFTLQLGSFSFVYTLLAFCLFFGLSLGFFLTQRIFAKTNAHILLLGLLLFGVASTQLLLSVVVSLNVWTIGKFSLKVFFSFLIGLALASVALVRTSSSRASTFKDSLRSISVITISAIAGVLSPLFLLIPSIGSQKGVLTSAGVCALGGLAITPASQKKYKWSATLIALAFLCALVALASRAGVSIPAVADYISDTNSAKAKKTEISVNNILFSKEDASAVATVATTWDNKDFFLTVNGVTFSSSAQNHLLVEYMLGHLPLLLHRAPKRSALIGGVGGGITCGALASYREMEVYCTEQSASALKGATYFYAYNNAFLDAPNIHLIRDDGRHFALTQPPNSLDIIVVNSPSATSIVGANYFSLDFYRLCANRLREGGILSQRLSLSGLSENELRSILATFQRAFPDASLWIAYDEVLLVGVKGKSNFNLDEIEKKFATIKAVQSDFKQVAIGSGTELVGRLLLGPVQIHNLHGNAQIITDNRNPLRFFNPFLHYKESSSAENWRWFSQARSDEIEAFVSGSEETFKRFRVSRTASALITEAWFLLEEGKKDDAVKLLETAIKVHPENQSGRRALSEIILEPVDSLVNQGKFSEAKLLVYRALDVYPDNPIALRWMAHQVAQSGDLGYARNLLDRARSLEPYNPDILADLAIVLFQLGRRDEALDMIQRALLYGRNNATPYFAMGVIKEFSGERNSAIMYYQKALGINPNMVEAIKRLEAMGITR